MDSKQFYEKVIKFVPCTEQTEPKDYQKKLEHCFEEYTLLLRCLDDDFKILASNVKDVMETKKRITLGIYKGDAFIGFRATVFHP